MLNSPTGLPTPAHAYAHAHKPSKNFRMHSSFMQRLLTAPHSGSSRNKKNQPTKPPYFFSYSCKKKQAYGTH